MNKSNHLVFLFCLFLLFSTIPSWGAGNGNIQGQVIVKSAKFQEGIVVYLKNLSGNFPVPQEPVKFDQIKLQFIPHVLPILTGTTVRFLNSDPLKHNVFSPDFEQYDLGTWGEGKGQAYRFTLTEGNPSGAKADPMRAYVQLCNIHPEMEGYIVVLPNPYFDTTDREGRFLLAQVSEGEHVLATWSEKYPPKEIVVTVIKGKTTRAVMDLTR